MSPSPYTPSHQPESPSEKIPNYLVWAILVTLCCCLPGGIVSIVYATKVDGLVASGDIAAAQEASDKAKMWAMISGGVGLLVNGLWLAFMVFGLVMGNA